MQSNNKLAALRDHLDKYLGLYVGIMIVLGIFLGYYFGGWVSHHEDLMKYLMRAAIYIMIFPMLIMLNIRELKDAFKNWKVVASVVILNFLYSPAMAVLLGTAFLSNPFIRLGLFIAWVVPCSSMSIGYVGIMRGNIHSATSMVALSFILSLFLIPLEVNMYLSWFSTGITLSHDALMGIIMSIVMTVVTVLVIPLVIAIPTHEALVRKMGFEKFKRISPLFPSITLLGMYFIIFIIFFAHASVIITHIHDVLGVLYSALVFGSVSISLFTILFKYIKLGKQKTLEDNYRSSMVAILTGIPKNEATAIAISVIALQALSPKVAFMAAMAPSLLPAFQVIFLIVFLKLRRPIIRYYGANVDLIEKEEFAAKA